MLDANTFYTGDVPCLVSTASVSLTRKSVSRCPISETGHAASAKNNSRSFRKDGHGACCCARTFHQRSAAKELLSAPQ